MFCGKEKSESQEIDSVTEAVQKGIKMNSQKPEIMDLPDEVLEMTFLKLSRYDIQHNLALVCRRFLNITRRRIFVPSVEIGKPFIESGMNFPECYLEKIEKVKKVYPNCNILLNCLLKDESEGDILPGYSWMKKFLPYDSSITKLTLRLEHNWQDTSDFLDFIFLENLESLDLDVSLTDYRIGSKSIQDVEAEFWKKFPNLKSLRVKTRLYNENPIAEFIDRICSTFRNLESFVHEADNEISPTYPKMPFKDEDKFPNLKYIKVEFKIDVGQNPISEDSAVLENFRKYLTAKCPKLKNPIQIEQTGDLSIMGIMLSKTFAFESK